MGDVRKHIESKDGVVLFQMEWGDMVKKEAYLRYVESKYGLSPADYEFLWVKQRGLCAICDKPLVGELSCVDHKHDGTKNARGILCVKCNNLLGAAHDSIDVLQKAIEYLRRNHEKKV